MASIGDIVIGLQMNASPFARSAQSARISINQIGQSAMATAGQLAGMLGVGGAIASIGFGVKLAADAEQTQIAFEVMLGSADQAKRMLSELKAFADKSPFDSIVSNEAAKKLMNYGIQGDDVMPTIRMLGDVAAGDSEKLDRLATAFGQMSSAGRLTGQDLLQFINAGFNPLQEIAKKTGESMADLKTRMEHGGVSTAEVTNAFRAATSEGGRFFGMTDRQSQTLSGRFNTMKDNVNTSLLEIGEAIIKNLGLSGAIDQINSFAAFAPFAIRNAGSLIQLTIVNWQIWFLELVPVAGGVMQTLTAFVIAYSTAGVAAFEAFVQNVKGGFAQIQNLATATWASIRAGIDAIGKGQNPLTASMEAFRKTFEAQEAAPVGKNFAAVFGQTFSETFQDIQKRQGLGMGVTNALKLKREMLLAQIGENESPFVPKNARQAAAAAANAPDAPGAADPERTDGGGPGRESRGYRAAVAGTQEAAEILLRGRSGHEANMESLAKQQLAATNRAAAAIEQLEVEVEVELVDI